MVIRIINAQCSRKILLKTIAKISADKRASLRYASSAYRPPVPFMEKPSAVFSGRALKHNWGVLPIIIIATIGFVLEICTTARNALTRDDVYYTRTAACDYIETRPGYHAPIRKLLVFNQKYEVPQDLTKALQGDPNGSSSKSTE